MRDIERIDKLLKRLNELWKKCPDLRLGQLICNVVRDPMLYYIEDEKLIEILESYYGDIK